MMSEKNRFNIVEGFKMFPQHTILYFLYTILILLLAGFGTLLIMMAVWVKDEYVLFDAITNWPLPIGKDQMVTVGLYKTYQEIEVLLVRVLD